MKEAIDGEHLKTCDIFVVNSKVKTGISRTIIVIVMSKKNCVES